MDRFVRGITLLSQLCGVFAAALIAASVVIVCEMVFVRYVLNQTTIWQTDFVTFSIVAATFIGSPYLLLNRGHVNVDVLPLYLGQKGRYRLALASMLMSFAFCAVMTVLTFQFWQEAWDNNWRSSPCGGRACGSPTRRCRSGWRFSACNTSLKSSNW